MRGEFPWRLTQSDVWRLRKDGFSVDEIAAIAGVSKDVATGMVVEATPHAPRESTAFAKAGADE